MNNVLKSLIVWLMLVAIPFQGFASASMTRAPTHATAPEHCAAMAAMHASHAMASAAATDHAMTSAAAADHAMASAGAADHAIASAAADDHAAHHHHAPGKCSTCASCCFGAAMPPTALLARMPADVPEIASFQFDIGQLATVDLALPERPPKTSLT